MSETARAEATAGAGVGPVHALRGAVAAAAGALGGDGGQAPQLERPRRPEFGDYSSNAAMALAPVLKAPPREIAGRLGEELRRQLGNELERVEVAGPGFLNVFLADSWFRGALGAIGAQGERFGEGAIPPAERERILVEFVSANPTGPLTAAGGRGAALGDSLSRVLEFAGHAVEREYYVNDYGTQVDLFGRSIAAAMTGTEPPEGGYRGDYVPRLAKRMQDEGIQPEDLDAVTRRGIELMVEDVRTTLERFRVRFDSFRSERELHEQGRVEQTLRALEQDQHVYSSEGALWLRTTQYGDDKDRVLRRSSGEPTYFASDIAYHDDKLQRGFDRLINVLGADHHGYLARMQAALEAIGDERERLEPLILQLVHVVERGERAQMSKRKGEFVTLDELMDDIGVDAARFFMLQRSHDTSLDLDLDLARAQSEENPVYYVQYAHARIASILRNAEERGAGKGATGPDGAGAAEAPLERAERSLIKRLLELPEEVVEACARRAPHRLTTYAREVAADFHAFYRDCRVIGADPPELERFRLEVCRCTKSTIARTLGLLGVEAPERM